MILNERLFQAVFNCATFPMVLVRTGPDFTVIAQNEQHKVICNIIDRDIVRQPLANVLEPALGKDSNDCAILRSSLLAAETTKEKVQIPVLKFHGYRGKDDSEGKSFWRIEIVPVPGTENDVECLLIIWQSIAENDPGRDLNDIVPVMETNLGKELAASGEQIEVRNEELVSVTEELKAVNEELVQTQEDLNKLSNELGQAKDSPKDDSFDKRLRIETQRDRLKRFLMQASAGICILDGPEFIVELVNPAFSELFPKRILLKKTFLEVLPEVRELKIWELIKEVYRSGKTFQGNEWPVSLINAVSGESETRYFNFICQARHDSNGTIDGLMLFVYEVTDMVMVRLEVEENEKHFHFLLNAIPQIAWTNTAAGEINFFNEQWYAYTGINIVNIQDHNFMEMVVHPDDLKLHKEQFKSILESENSGNYEIRKRGADGEYRWFLIHMQPIKDDADQLLLWVGTATDIHELKLLQQKKDDLINIASHELKTPVASLKASIQLLHRMKHDSSQKMQNLIDLAGRSVDKVSGLITDLLDTNQLSEGGIPLKRTTFNLFSLAENWSRLTLKEENYTIDIKGDKDIMVNADAERIDQVITNIVSNAIKYAPESNKIDILIERINDNARLSITDKGPGIPADKVPLLFNRYYRVGRSEQPGSGLGLYICSEIIARHNGEIGVESSEGHGSTFWFTLPLSK